MSTSAENLTSTDRFLALFVGPKHCGKTVAACSFLDPNSSNYVEVLDFDGRIRGINGAPWIDKKRVRYTYYPPKVTATQTPTYIKINTDMEALLVKCTIGQNDIETLVGDSLTAETFAMLCDAIPLTHKGEHDKVRGKHIGVLNMAGPEDYGFEATATYNLLAFFRSLPIKNIILTAHVVDKYGKADPNDPFSETVVTGEKLSLRDKISTNISIYFDHIFRFDRRMYGSEERFYVTFRSNIACTSYAKLPTGEVDITGKSFQDVLKGYINKPTGEVK